MSGGHLLAASSMAATPFFLSRTGKKMKIDAWILLRGIFEVLAFLIVVY